MGESKTILFLDIDGVLNDHGPVLDYYCGINHENVNVFNTLNKLMHSPDIVISSAWRYMIHSGAMTLDGFKYMMMTHGFQGKIVGLTVTDEMICGRANQVEFYLDTFPEYTSYLILDDLDLGFTCKHKKHFYQTKSDRGLISQDIPKILSMKLEK